MNNIVHFLGRGSAFNYNEDNTSCYFKEDNKMVLIDCGEKIASKIISLNILDDIKELVIVITHLHSDHIGSLEPLLTYINVFKSEIKTQIIYPNGNELLQLLKSLNFEFSCKISHAYQQADIKIIPVEQTHIKNSYGYFIYTKNMNFFYSGDTSIINEDAVHLLKENKIDYIYHEVSIKSNKFHTGIDELCNVFDEKIRNRVFLMHFENKEIIEKAKEKRFEIVEVNK